MRSWKHLRPRKQSHDTLIRSLTVREQEYNTRANVVVCEVCATQVSSPKGLESCRCISLLSEVTKSLISLVQLDNLPRAKNISGYKALSFLNSFNRPSFQDRK